MATKLKVKSQIIGTVLGCVKAYVPNNINTLALDGTVYIQTAGVATVKRNVSVLCSDPALRDRLDEAANNGDIVVIDNWKDKEIRGYIEKNINWKEWRNESGVGKFTLLVTEVLDA